MSGATPSVPSIQQVEDALRDGLAQGDSILASARPVLSHLLTSGDQTMFSDEIIARIRGMANDCARQLLDALARDADPDTQDRTQFYELQPDLAYRFTSDPEFLAFCHALTQEALLADSLQQRSGFDPVLSPLMQEMAAAKDPDLCALAMHVIAAQARFIQQQRRMELPLGELSADLFHKAMLAMRGCAAVDDQACQRVENRLRASFDEGHTRVGQITRFIMTLDRKANRALLLDHAGIAIFATALAMATRQDREIAVLALGENQLARLALSLRAAGLSQSVLEEQFLFLHPEIELPPGFEYLSAQQAAAMLATSSSDRGS